MTEGREGGNESTWPTLWGDGRSVFAVGVGVVGRRADVLNVVVYKLIPIINRHGQKAFYNLRNKKIDKTLKQTVLKLGTATRSQNKRLRSCGFGSGNRKAQKDF